MKPSLHAVLSLEQAGCAVPPAPTFTHRLSCRGQAGAATVEFALIALFAFLPLLLGVVELGRLFYIATTTQEITRRAAREQVVRWIDQGNTVQRNAVFQAAGSGTVTLPGGPEISSANVRLEFLNSAGTTINSPPASAAANLANCIKNQEPCIRYVRASLRAAGDVQLLYRPVTGWFDTIFQVPLPGATVVMPAEALGLL